MPTYEYACRSCGNHVEVFQRFSDPPLTECGVCGGPLRKVFHPAGILFKGSGFYATDSRRRSASLDGSGGKSAERAGAKEPSGSSSAASSGDSTGGSSSGPDKGAGPGSKEKSA